MAELLDIAVEWNERIANPPRFGVLVDRMPKFDVWEKRPLELDQPGWHLYYAQDGEFASFFTWSGNADDGFAGWRRTVTLTDGTTRRSSAAGPVRRLSRSGSATRRSSGLGSATTRPTSNASAAWVGYTCT